MYSWMSQAINLCDQLNAIHSYICVFRVLESHLQERRPIFSAKKPTSPITLLLILVLPMFIDNLSSQTFKNCDIVWEICVNIIVISLVDCFSSLYITKHINSIWNFGGDMAKISYQLYHGLRFSWNMRRHNIFTGDNYSMFFF